MALQQAPLSCVCSQMLLAFLERSVSGDSAKNDYNFWVYPVQRKLKIGVSKP
jgi:hypothetical protein